MNKEPNKELNTERNKNIFVFLSYMEDLEKEFQTCVFRIKSRDTMPSDEDLLILYGLYKQATQGDCNIPQPWKVQVEPRARWDAWFKNHGMYRQTAMEKYIEKVNELLGGQ